MNTDIGAGLVVRGLGVYCKWSKWSKWSRITGTVGCFWCLGVYCKWSKWSKWSRISRWIIRLDHLDHLDHFLYTATIPFIEGIGLVSPPS